MGKANLGHQGFDEFMNLVIDDAVEVKQVTKENPVESRKELGMQNVTMYGTAMARILTWFAGQILLKGDNVSLIQNLQQDY